jgi:hypothetical protein
MQEGQQEHRFAFTCFTTFNSTITCRLVDFFLDFAGRALSHNDRSIQENHHIMTMFIRLSTDSSVNILQVDIILIIIQGRN